MKKCPWCGKEAELVKICYLSEQGFMLKDVCPACRKAWMRKLKQCVIGKA